MVRYHNEHSRMNVFVAAIAMIAATAASDVCFVVGFGTGAGAVPPMPFKWPVVGTLPDFLSRGGVDRLREIYEASSATAVVKPPLIYILHIHHSSCV